MILIKTVKIIILIISYILSPLFYLFLKLIKPVKIIRITPLLSNRYGHLVINPEIYFLEKNTNKKEESRRIIDLFYTVRYGVSNYEILKLWKKKMIIFPYYFLEPLDRLLNQLEKKNNVPKVKNFVSKIRDLDGNLNKYPPTIYLDEEQNKFCIKELEKKSIDINHNKYVCLFNRDDAYLNSFKKKKNWNYLSHHNYKIKSFELAARKLSSKNIKVFRMGAKVEDKFDLNDENIFDYANSSLRSELMDIFLASNCYFGISCGTGSSHVAILNRKPIVDLNANLHHLFTFLDKSILLSKHYFSKKKNRNLTLTEILNYREDEIRKREQLEIQNIEMIDCSQEEIADAVDEMYLRLENQWNDTEDIKLLQKKFRNHNWKNIYRLHEDKSMAYHGEIRGRYSSTFLLKNRNWLN